MSTAAAAEGNERLGDPLVEVRGLVKYFLVRGGVLGRTVGFIRAVDGVTFSITRGKTLGLIGESGCGKTTVGRCILRLLEPTEGAVRFDGRDLAKVPRSRLVSAAAGLMVTAVVVNIIILLIAILNRAFGPSLVVPDLFMMLAAGFAPGSTAGIQSAFGTGVGNAWVLLAIVGAIGGGYGAGAAIEAQRPAPAAIGALLVLGSLQVVLGAAALVLILVARKEFGKDTARSIRKDMQIVFQDPFGSLNPRVLVSHTVGEPLQAFRREVGERYPEVSGGGRTLSGLQIRQIVKELIARVGLNPEHLNRFPHEFSGGQRQRICVARALALKPAFVVLDEPTSALDVSVQAQILNLLKEIQRERALTYLFISHHLAVIRHMCDDVAVMYLGKIVERASNDALFKAPMHPYTMALLSAVPSVEPESRRERIVLEGEIPSPANPPSGCRFHTRCNFALEREVREVEAQWEEGYGAVVKLADPLAAPQTVRLVVDGKAVDPMAALGAVAYEVDEIEGVGAEVRVHAVVARGAAARVRYRRYRGPCVLEEPKLLERAAGHEVACHFSEEALAAQRTAAAEKRPIGAVIAEMRAPIAPSA